jgi:hypothetical protein
MPRGGASAYLWGLYWIRWGLFKQFQPWERGVVSQLADFRFVMMSAIGVVLSIFCPFVDFRPSTLQAPLACSWSGPLSVIGCVQFNSVHSVVNSGAFVLERSRTALASAYTSGKGSQMAQVPASTVIRSTVVHLLPAAAVTACGWSRVSGCGCGWTKTHSGGCILPFRPS